MDKRPNDILRTHHLTADEIKSCKAFAHLSDEQAKEMADTLKTLCEIAFCCYKKEQEMLGKSA